MTVRRGRRGSKWVCRGALLAWLGVALVSVGSAAAAVSEITATDVTPRAFSVVWSSDEAVTSATVRVYDDEAGTTELTGTLDILLVSQSIPAAHGLGLVKVDVAGLLANTCYYFQTETTTASGTVAAPAAAPFTEVCTEVAATRSDPSHHPVASDLILDEVYAPDGSTPGSGTLVLLSAPGLSSNPVTAFVGDGIDTPYAVVDMNNLFDAATGSNLTVSGGEVLQITEMRGLLCAGLVDQRRTKFRRAPAHEEIPTTGAPIVQAETPDLCFFADTYCDDTIDILDAQRVLNAFGARPGDCAFNADLDIVADDVINVLDVQSVLNRFGESAPFVP